MFRLILASTGLTWGVAVQAASLTANEAQGQVVSSAELVAKAEQSLRESLSWMQAPVVLTPLRTPDAVRVPTGGLTLEARPEPEAGERVAGVMRVRVSLNLDGRTVRVLPMLFQVVAPGRGAVSARDLTAGHVVSADDVQTGDVDLAAYPDGRSMDVDALVGRRLKRDIKARQAFVPARLESLPPVLRGERVAIVLSQAGIKLHAPGTALADGHVGDRTKVRLWHKDVVDAVVTGIGVVRMQEGAQR